MQACIDDLDKTVVFAGYAVSKTTQDVAFSLNEKADDWDKKLRQWRDKQSEDMRSIYESQLRTEGSVLGMQRQLTMYPQEDSQDKQKIVQKLDNLELLLVRASRDKGRPSPQDDDKRKEPSKGTAKGDPAEKKYKMLRTIKSHFDEKKDHFEDWRDAQKENAAQENDIQESFVEHTGEWLTCDAVFKEWTQGKNSVLWIKGCEGIGK